MVKGGRREWTRLRTRAKGPNGMNRGTNGRGCTRTCVINKAQPINIKETRESSISVRIYTEPTFHSLNLKFHGSPPSPFSTRFLLKQSFTPSTYKNPSSLGQGQGPSKKQRVLTAPVHQRRFLNVPQLKQILIELIHGAMVQLEHHTLFLFLLMIFLRQPEW